MIVSCLNQIVIDIIASLSKSDHQHHIDKVYYACCVSYCKIQADDQSDRYHNLGDLLNFNDRPLIFVYILLYLHVFRQQVFVLRVYEGQ